MGARIYAALGVKKRQGEKRHTGCAIITRVRGGINRSTVSYRSGRRNPVRGWRGNVTSS